MIALREVFQAPHSAERPRSFCLHCLSAKLLLGVSECRGQAVVESRALDGRDFPLRADFFAVEDPEGFLGKCDRTRVRHPRHKVENARLASHCAQGTVGVTRRHFIEMVRSHRTKSVGRSDQGRLLLPRPLFLPDFEEAVCLVFGKPFFSELSDTLVAKFLKSDPAILLGMVAHTVLGGKEVRLSEPPCHKNTGVPTHEEFDDGEVPILFDGDTLSVTVPAFGAGSVESVRPLGRVLRNSISGVSLDVLLVEDRGTVRMHRSMIDVDAHAFETTLVDLDIVVSGIMRKAVAIAGMASLLPLDIFGGKSESFKKTT